MALYVVDCSVKSLTASLLSSIYGYMCNDFEALVARREGNSKIDVTLNYTADSW
jgi:hypothetical protein